jgi:hypothetical protein
LIIEFARASMYLFEAENSTSADEARQPLCQEDGKL